VDPDATVEWLRDWARNFLRPGQRLTTPITVQNVEDGVLMRFQPTGAEYLDFDEVETPDDKWASAKPGASKPSKSDGALLLVVEETPAPRVRVTRAEMADGVIVKEMSEAAVIAKLEKDLKELEATTGRRK